MADIELLIKIPEKTYRMINEGFYDYGDMSIIIQNGTPLPKRHGRLIDTDVLCDYFWDNRSKLYTHKDLRIVIDRQPTIIEEDKAENCDNDHDCEHCDWVECPLDKENKE